MLPRILTLTFALMMVGCACSKTPPVATTMPVATVRSHAYAEPACSYPASALVFDPPTSRYMPPLDLSREGRYPAAFAGFQQSTSTFTLTWTDNRQSTDFFDSYDRHTFSTQIGTSSR